MYSAKNAMKQSIQITRMLKRQFPALSEAKLAAAAHDLHDIAWQCQMILEDVEAIRKGRLTPDQVCQKITDIVVGLDAHINKCHLRPLKRFSSKLNGLS